MLIGHWHHLGPPTGTGPALGAHIHGRELEVRRASSGPWHWCVASPHGVVLAEGDAASCAAAEAAAENEALAVHPPSAELLERLLT